MDHSQFYMTAEAYAEDRLLNRIAALEKEIRQLKGIPEPAPEAPMTIHEILTAGISAIEAKHSYGSEEK